MKNTVEDIYMDIVELTAALFEDNYKVLFSKSIGSNLVE